MRLCCIEVAESITFRSVLIAYAIRMQFGRPSSSILFRAVAAMATSVASVLSVRDRNAFPITLLYRPFAASTFARRV